MRLKLAYNGCSLYKQGMRLGYEEGQNKYYETNISSVHEVLHMYSATQR